MHKIKGDKGQGHRATQGDGSPWPQGWGHLYTDIWEVVVHREVSWFTHIKEEVKNLREHRKEREEE